ncbi:MAG: hypothetical protein CMD35_07695 [Flavobacteriales bacterium]|nr:hypothetical protein [Flavobacteriales bacterium]|tara:strand:- start:64433 stop:66172 length:1740 start_codon:yes stop_codon:yes gene_type:complete
MIRPENIEEKIFQYFEGELSAKESLELENFIKNNPEYQVDFEAWKRSVVPDEQAKYRFVEELLVNERFSPKGWFKWASGGALVLGLVFGSVVLMDKFNESENSLSKFKIEQDNQVVLKDNLVSKNNDSNSNDSFRFSSDTDFNNFSGIKSESSKNETVSLNKTKSGSLREDFVSKDYSLEFQNDDVNIFRKEQIFTGDTEGELNKSYSVLNSNSQPNSNRNKAVANEVLNQGFEDSGDKKYISIVSSSKFKKYAHIRLTPELKKSKYKYENPNKPRLFIKNNKDPYLNYALAHTVEENGSFVGNFNDGQGIRAEMLYRSEWPSVTSEKFTSQIFSIDSRVEALKGGVGLLINADRIGHGKLNSTAVSLIYSPKYTVKNISVEPSFKYTFNQKNISWNQVDENDVKDPRNGVLYASIPVVPDDIVKTNLVHHDLGIGILINTNKMYIGGQIDHLNKASYSDDDFDQEIFIPYKISAMVGTEVMKSNESDLSISPSLNYIQFGVYNALWVNAQVLYNGFFLAGGVATNEEIMTSFGYSNNKVRLVYALGFTKPREFSGLPLTGKYYESHQLSLRVNLQPKR